MRMEGVTIPKLYLVYIPKYQDSTPPFLITNIISQYMHNFRHGRDTTIISCPGCLSSNERMDDYANNFRGIVPGCNKFGAFRAYNGYNHRLNDFKNAIVNARPSITLLDIAARNHSDHRKMLFFIEESPNTIVNINTRALANEYLDYANVQAVLIGSSNQSFNTYFSPTGRNGECDILMYIDDEDPDEQQWPEGTIVSGELFGRDPEVLLKNMLKEVFDHYLDPATL